MATKLTINIDQVRDDCRRRFLDGHYRTGLPCHEVDGFGDCQHDALYMYDNPRGLRDWPTVWAVVLIEGEDDFNLSFHFHAGHESRGEALWEARRLSISLLHDQEVRRQSLRRSISSNPPSVNLEVAAVDPYMAFNDRLGRERVLFGPLSEAGIAPLARGDGSGETRGGLLRLQQQLATKLLCLITRGLWMLPADARRCVCSFAFTPRSCPRLLRAPGGPELMRMSFGVTFYIRGHESIRGRWIARVPLDATLNDLCRLVQAKLCKGSRGGSIGGRYDDEDVLSTVVLLLSFPFYQRDYRPGIMPPYFYLAHCFQRFAARFPKRKGLLHVQALAMSKEAVIWNTT